MNNAVSGLSSPYLADRRLFGAAEPRGDAVLYCLPDAGSGAGAFAAWPGRFPAHLDVRPLCLPGRERRIAEPPVLSPADIADALARRHGRDSPPFALYGHSMGACLAFDVACDLLGRPEAPLPVALYVGGAIPPDERPPLVDAADWPEEELVTELIERAGAGAQLRDEPEIRELVLPVVRADLRWLGSRPSGAGFRLPFPVVAFAGAADPTDGARRMYGWARRAAGEFRLYTVPGGHAFHREPPEELVTWLSAELAAVLQRGDADIA
jgi:surfactin synthase thioesterase subunit